MSVVSFGTFLVDLDSGEIHRQGRLIRLQHQPFELLRVLLEQPGQVVARESLHKRLWPEGITVDFDQSLNKSITKLRDALGDDAANPRYIETIPKRGYRFIAPVTMPPVAMAPAAPRADEVAPGLPSASSRLLATPPVQLQARPIWLSAAIITALAATMALSLGTSNSGSRIVANDSAVAPRKVSANSPMYAARDAYERGRLALARRSRESIKVSVEHFQRAVTLSPQFADGYVGLADSWSLMSSYGLVDPREGMPRARDAANRALTLSPGLARAHASLGRTAMIFDWDWPTAEGHFQRAIDLEPGTARTHQWYSYLLSALARHGDAIGEAQRAVAAEPHSLNTNTGLGYVLYAARRHDEAAAQLERTLQIDPDFAQARRNLALVRVQQLRFREAIGELQRVAVLNASSPSAIAELAWVQALDGDAPSARKALALLERMQASTYVPPDSLALVYAGLGRHDEAASWLQRAMTMRVSALAHLPVDPMWDSVRDDPRVQQLTDTIRRGR